MAATRGIVWLDRNKYDIVGEPGRGWRAAVVHAVCIVWLQGGLILKPDMMDISEGQQCHC